MPPPLPPAGCWPARWHTISGVQTLLLNSALRTFYKSEARGQRWLADGSAQSRGEISLDIKAKGGQKGQEAGWLLKTESRPETKRNIK